MPEIVQAQGEAPENKETGVTQAVSVQPAATPETKPITSVSLASESSGVAEAAPSRQPLLNPVPPSEFGHAQDYAWLMGKLQYSRFNKTWRLRYASVDEVDPYGGSVTIVDDLRVAGLKDGQYVRVEGQLLNPELKSIAPPYEVNSIQPLDKNN
jgi:hypothetical protein